MRLAVQLSGEFRALQSCYSNFEQHILNGFPGAQLDVFIHTWWKDENDEFVSGHGKGLALFKPRSYFLDKYEHRTDLHALPRAYSMFFSIQRANDARKEYEKIMEAPYDLVMRYRTDCYFDESIAQAIRPYVLDRKSFLCIPKPKQVVADGPVEQNEEESICDWFAIGTPDAMDVYCDTYNTWKDIGLPIVPESMLAMQLKARGITNQTILKRPEVSMKLVRENRV